MTHEQHMADLKALAEKDPDFFKYLQENDAELLDFDPEAGAGADSDEDEEEDDEEDSEDDSDDEGKVKKGKGKGKERAAKPTPVLTSEILKKWQRSLLEVSPSPPRTCFTVDVRAC
jgi:nucleolar complex protein 2